MPKQAPLKILFVCSRNQWRSPTAEKIYNDHPSVLARSRGMSRNARRTVAAADLRWADIVFVMENKHRSRLQAEFPRAVAHTQIHVLGIPDDYRFMDPALINELEAAVEPILASSERGSQHRHD